MVATLQKKTAGISWEKRSGRSGRLVSAVRDASSPWCGGKKPLFLDLAKVVRIHMDQVIRYGGSEGVRNMDLLRSALAQPEASFGGTWLHEDLFEMAAAYAFHICQNHPFVDGNKRTALGAALIFLEMNGVSLSDPKDILSGTMLAVAAGKINKKELARVFRILPTGD